MVISEEMIRPPPTIYKGEEIEVTQLYGSIAG